MPLKVCFGETQMCRSVTSFDPPAFDSPRRTAAAPLHS
ncbi:hypothetical protein FTUN_3792 [Frigoriglobus tundricola]|uniref:Uncharacterized protein n=1 Tax=Frigoriglobus tundricola TaxID=2774151 RepID=A0A6M5YQF0_9BACT|nr:hypothetical protein FTUN_3792 [Frigoriglobus tundricola]